jgi:hypothetical protein
MDKWLHRRVIVDLCSSPVYAVASGVPRDSVKNSILILIFVNHIDYVCCANTTL